MKRLISGRVATVLTLAMSCGSAIGVAAQTPATLPGARAPEVPQVRMAAPLDTAAILAGARRDIEAGNAAWVSAFRRRDASVLADAFADSALFITPNGAVIHGRTAIVKMYAARFPSTPKVIGGAVVQDGTVAVSRDRIYEWGHAWLETARRTPGTTSRSGGAYLAVWERQADGHWRIVRNLAL
jgi:uncharacterized protein (TIGR02246 family)